MLQMLPALSVLIPLNLAPHCMRSDILRGGRALGQCAGMLGKGQSHLSRGPRADYGRVRGHGSFLQHLSGLSLYCPSPQGTVRLAQTMNGMFIDSLCIS